MVFRNSDQYEKEAKILHFYLAIQRSINVAFSHALINQVSTCFSSNLVKELVSSKKVKVR